VQKIKKLIDQRISNQKVMANQLVYTLSFYVYGVLVFASIAGFLVMGIDYYGNYQQRSEQHEQASKYIMKVCKDATTKDEIGAHKDCEARKKMVREIPSVYALYDILEHWSLCGRSGCENMLVSISDSVLKLAAMLLILIVCIMVTCGWGLRRMSMYEVDSYSLPAYGKAALSYEDNSGNKYKKTM
jgi:hypothetical protein